MRRGQVWRHGVEGAAVVSWVASVCRQAGKWAGEGAWGEGWRRGWVGVAVQREGQEGVWPANKNGSQRA